MFTASLFNNVVIWTGLMTVASVSSQSPQNAVTELGGQAIFNCTTKDITLTSWVQSRDGGSANTITIAGGCIIRPDIPSNYRAESGTNYCNLIVSSMTMQQAGVYTCTDASKPTISRALLTVVETPAKPKTNITTNVTEGEFVGLQCSIKYNGSMAPASILRPIMYWTDKNGQNVSSSYDPSNPNEAVSTATFAVGRQDQLQFTCHIYFQLNINASNIGGYATNTPTNTYNANTSPIVPYYGPGEIRISEDDRNGQCIVAELTCTSSASPPANYTWTDVTDEMDKKVVSNTSSYSQAEGNRVYECAAYNYIRDVRHFASVNYSVPTINPIPCGQTENDSTRWIIVVAAVGGYIGCNLFCMSCFLVYYNSGGDKKDNRGKMNRQFPWLVKMLPCMNAESCSSSCCWCVMFIIMAVLLGLFVFPTLVMIVSCSCCSCCFKEVKYRSKDSAKETQRDHVNDVEDHSYVRISEISRQHSGRQQQVQLDHYLPKSSTSLQVSAKPQNQQPTHEVQYADLNVVAGASHRPASLVTKPPGEVNYAEVAKV